MVTKGSLPDIAAAAGALQQQPASSDESKHTALRQLVKQSSIPSALSFNSLQDLSAQGADWIKLASRAGSQAAGKLV